MRMSAGQERLEPQFKLMESALVVVRRFTDQFVQMERHMITPALQGVTVIIITQKENANLFVLDPRSSDQFVLGMDRLMIISAWLNVMDRQ